MCVCTMSGLSRSSKVMVMATAWSSGQVPCGEAAVGGVLEAAVAYRFSWLRDLNGISSAARMPLVMLCFTTCHATHQHKQSGAPQDFFQGRAIGGGKCQWLGATMASAEHEPITGVWGEEPQAGSRGSH